MIKRNLLTDTEAARVLNCSVQELPQRQQHGEIEEIPFPDHRMYRIVRKSRATDGEDEPLPHSPALNYPGDKSDPRDFSHPDRNLTDAATPPSKALVDRDFPADGVNVSLLLEQNKDRNRLIHERRIQLPSATGNYLIRLFS